MVKAEPAQMLAQPISISTVKYWGKDSWHCIRLDKLERSCGLVADLGNVWLMTLCCFEKDALQELPTTSPCMVVISIDCNGAVRISQHFLAHSQISR